MIWRLICLEQYFVHGKSALDSSCHHTTRYSNVECVTPLRFYLSKGSNSRLSSTSEWFISMYPHKCSYGNVYFWKNDTIKFRWVNNFVMDSYTMTLIVKKSLTMLFGFLTSWFNLFRVEYNILFSVSDDMAYIRTDA